MSDGSPAACTMRPNSQGKPPMMPSPRVAGNTSVSGGPTPCDRRISHAASDSGLTLSPVLVSSSRAVRRARSSSFQRRFSTSPRRQPVSSRNRVAEIAAGHTAPGGRAPGRLGLGGTAAASSPRPNNRYSSSDSRRSRRPSGNRITPRVGLSGRSFLRTA